MRVTSVALALLLAATSFARADDIDSWGSANANEAWSAARGDLHFESRASDVAWWVQVDAHDGWGRTSELVVTRPWKGPVRVDYVRTLGQNLIAQMDALHATSPRIGVAEAAASLQLRRGAVDGTSCPAIVAIAERLPEVSITALPANRLTMDSPTYEVTLAATHRSGRTLSVEKGENDLARWCEEILAAAVACEAAPPAQ